MNDEFYKFRMEGDEPASAELLIFAAIGDWEEMGDVSAKAFSKSLSELPKSVKRIDLHINSPGGSVFEASAIYSRLADHKSQKIVYVDGLAASAASIIAMVGHKIYIRSNAMMMIHLPSGIAMGNADDMRHMATALDAVTDTMINIYAKRTGGERDVIRSLMSDETWFTPQDAVEKGFADEERGVVKAAAVVGEKRVVINGCEFDLGRFNNVPAFAATQQTGGRRMKPKGTAEDERDLPPNDDENEEGKEGKAGKGGKGAPAKPPEPPKPPAEPAGQPAHPQPQPAAETDYDKGVKAERDRITALQALDRPATHAIVEAAIKDGKQAADIIAACMDAMDKAGKRDARHADASVLGGISGGDALEEDEEKSKQFGAKLTERIQARVKGRSPLRAGANGNN
jgi:ATP-dependent protease ClpP protease subunit